MSANPFDEFKRAPDPFDEFKPAVPEAPPVGAVLRAAVPVNPEQAAEARRLSQRYSAPPDVVLRNLPQFQLKATTDELEDALRSSPILSQQFRVKPYVAQIAHDDVPTLAKIETAATKAARYAVGADPGKGLLHDLPGMAVDVGLGATAGVGEMIFNLTGAVYDLVGLRKWGADMRGFAKASEEARKSFGMDADSDTARAWKSGLGSAGQSLAMMPLGLAGAGPAVAGRGATLAAAQMGAAGGMGAGVAADAYFDAIEKGVSRPMAVAYAVGQGGVEYLTEKLPVGMLLKDLAANTGFVKIVARQAVAEGLYTEQVATFFQDLNEWATLNPEKPVADFLRERPDAAYQTFVGALAGAVVSSGVSQSVAKLSEAVAGQQLEALQAIRAEEQLKELMTLAGQAKLADRSPEQLRAFVDEAGAGTTVRFDAARLLEVFKQDMQALSQALPSVDLQALQEQAASGGEVQVALGELVTGTRGTGLEQTALEHARLGDSTLSAAEAREVQSRVTDDLQARVARAIAQAQDQDAARASHDAVRQLLTDQLVASGAYSPAVSEGMATWAAAFYTTMGARLGVTAEEFYQRYPLRVLGGAQQAQGGVLNGVMGQALPGFADAPALDAWLAENTRLDPEQLKRRDEGVGTITVRVGEKSVRYDAGMTGRDRVEHDSSDVRLLYRLDDGRLVWWERETGTVHAVAADDPRIAFKPGKESAPARPAERTPFEMAVEVDGDEHTLLVPDLPERLTDAEFADELAMSGADDAVLDAFRALRADRAGTLQQPAYHGTPYRGIERFDTSKIGTGEGAQAYGWGLYFASKKEIAEWYREKLSKGSSQPPRRFFLGEEVQPGSPTYHAATLLDNSTLAQARKEVRGWVADAKPGENVDHYRAVLRILEAAEKKSDFKKKAPQGQLYKVEIPDDSEMLLWGKPLSEQPDVVQRSARTLKGDINAAWLEDELERRNAEWEELTGDDLYTLVQKALVDDALVPNAGSEAEQAQIDGRTDKAASLLLADDGIKGIKYPAEQMSGKKEVTSYNYVIFSGDDVAITEQFYQSARVDRTETPEFKRWFGDSKVVDANGKPLVVYHGTRAQFDVFDTRKIGAENGRSEGAGFYFTTDEQTARSYGEPMAVYLSIKKPLAYNAKPFNTASVQKLLARIAEFEAEESGSDWRDGFLANFVDTYAARTPEAAAREAARSFSGEDTALDQLGGIIGSGVDANLVNRALKASLGYDGYIAKGFSGEGKSGGDIWVATSPEQIKSATGNDGSFDANDPSILSQQRDRGPRGTFNPHTLELALSPHADLSTWFHETGHFFLEVLADVGSQPDSPLADDWGKVLKWFGVTGEQWAAMDLDAKRPYHERWAESVEQYVMEGKAPSRELQPLMRKFAAWLIDVYRRMFKMDKGASSKSVVDQFLAQRGAQYSGPGLGQPNVEEAAALEAEAQRIQMGVRARIKAERDAGADQISDATLALNRADGDRAFALLARAQELRKPVPKIVTSRKPPAWFADMPDAQRQAVDSLPEWAGEGGFALRKGGENAEDDIYTSAESNFTDYEVVPGVRSVPLKALGDLGGYAETDEQRRITDLAERMRNGREITPIFVGVDATGETYIIEGQHRARAFAALGMESIPAKVIVDFSELPKGDTLAQGAQPTGQFNADALRDSIHKEIAADEEVIDALEIWMTDGETPSPEVNAKLLNYMRRMPPSTRTFYRAQPRGVKPHARGWASWTVNQDTTRYFTERDSETLTRNGAQGIDLEEVALWRTRATGQLHNYGSQGEWLVLNASVFAQGAQPTGQFNAALNDDIRRVMDRMLATDEQIAEANEIAGLVPEVDADAEAAERLNKRSMADLRWAVKARDKVIAKLKREARGIEKRIRAEVTAEVNQMPEVQAKDMLAKTRKENGRELNDTERAVIADAFGYESVDAMLKAIDAFGKKSDAVDGRTERRMLEKHGDLIDERAIKEAANEAVHNEARARSLATELRTQAEMLGTRADTGETNAAGRKTTVNVLVEAAKQFGANVVARTPLRDLKSAAWRHTQAERRAAKRWQEATAAGKTAEAVKAKQDQMLQHAAARAAIDARAEAAKLFEFFKRVAKGNDEKVVEKGRDPDIVNAARAVLAAYSVETPTTKAAADYLKLVEKNEPEVFAAVEPYVTAAVQSAQPLDSLTFEELQALADTIDQLWYLAKESRTGELNGDKLDRDEIENKLFARLEAIGIPDRVPGEVSAVTAGEARLRKLAELRGNLTRMEQWTEAMDAAGEGVFKGALYRPISDAAVRVRTKRVDAFRRLSAAVEKLAPLIEAKPIAAPELGYTFGKGDGHNNTGMAELLPALLNVGNASNKAKLLLGRDDKVNGGKWATELPDGTLDTGKWDAFLARLHAEGVLRKEHWDFVQEVWDTLESLKPDAQKAHRRVFGRYFAEVTAEPVATPFGEYRGGYYPAQTDTDLVVDQEIRKLAEQENENMSFSFPAVNRGFTKSRMESYRKPLKLDINVMFQHVDKVILFSEMQPTATMVNRIMRSPKVSQPLERILPGTYKSQLVPWIADAARQITERPVSGDGGFNRAATMLRARVGMQMMMGNLLNSAQQVTGVLNAASKLEADGFERTAILKAAAKWASSPKALRDEVWARSPMMKNRGVNEVAAMMDTMREIMFNPTPLEKTDAWTRRHAYFLQTWVDNQVSPLVWSAGYAAYLNKLPKTDTTGMTPAELQALLEKQERDAVFYADGLVRQTQGSNAPEDLARFERGTGFVRLFTQFAGYFNMQANTNAASVIKLAQQGGLKKNQGRLFYVLMTGVLAPIWLAEGIALAFRGGAGDDDKDGAVWDDWLRSIFGLGTFKGLVSMVPGFGPVASAAVNRVATDSPADDRISPAPVLGALESSSSVAVYYPYKAITGELDEVNKQKLVRDLALTIGIVTGAPAAMVARPLGYLAGVADDRIEPTGPVDTARGLLTGTPSPESKVR